MIQATIQTADQALPQELLSLALPVRSALEEAVGRPFGLWQRIDSWQPAPGDDSVKKFGAASAAAIAQALDTYTLDSSKPASPTPNDRSTTLVLDDGRRLLAAPIRAASIQSNAAARILVVGLIEPSTAAVARALADSLLSSNQLRQDLATANRELDHCIFQITASFEELAWLRAMAEHFEICSLREGLSRAAQSALPTLRMLIYAQELFLFGACTETSKDRSQAESADRNCASKFPLLSNDGSGLISEETARQLLAKIAGCDTPQSIVWNSPDCAEAKSNPGIIRNYVLTPVLKCQELYGWLLAMNKDMPLDDPIWNGSEADDQNLIEFGTTEAGLMSTMAVMLATHGKNVELLKEKDSLLVGVIRALVNTIDAKDAYTCGHSDRVALVSKRIAKQLGQSTDDCEQAYMGGLLHDIGKIGVPDNVLGKADRLTPEEYELIKTHPAKGVEILKHLKPFNDVLPGVLHHHEAFNGSGYPAGLAGEEIPLLGRIISVADSYDAMTSNRTYRQGMSTDKAEDILRKGAGVYWDGAVIDAFFAARQDIYAICGTGGTQTLACPV